MNQAEFLQLLEGSKIEYALDEPMCRHTTFKIGGNADVFVCVHSVEQLKLAVSFAQKCGMPFFILGKGSNLLVSDDGIEGAVIDICGMDEIVVNGNEIIAFAGASLRNVCIYAQKAGLSGLEFAFGIPGTVGGALYMNAGAYGGEMSQVVSSAEVLKNDGTVMEIGAADMALGYRTSVFKSSKDIIVSVKFTLQSDDKDAIRERMEDYFGRRREKQPLEYPSAGSTFKRPQGYFAGALIEQNNLKGVSVGGAQVSEKHAGFVINRCKATCKDVLALIEKIKNTVRENDGVELEPEVIFVGR